MSPRRMVRILVLYVGICYISGMARSIPLCTRSNPFPFNDVVIYAHPSGARDRLWAAAIEDMQIAKTYCIGGG